jgi:hypothetical protein
MIEVRLSITYAGVMVVFNAQPVNPMSIFEESR